MKPNCDYPNSNTFIAGILHNIPINGINFTIGNGSCFNGYYNSPLKSKETYRFGLLPIISNCKVRYCCLDLIIQPKLLLSLHNIFLFKQILLYIKTLISKIKLLIQK